VACSVLRITNVSSCHPLGAAQHPHMTRYPDEVTLLRTPSSVVVRTSINHQQTSPQHHPQPSTYHHSLPQLLLRAVGQTSGAPILLPATGPPVRSGPAWARCPRDPSQSSCGRAVSQLERLTVALSPTRGTAVCGQRGAVFWTDSLTRTAPCPFSPYRRLAVRDPLSETE